MSLLDDLKAAAQADLIGASARVKAYVQVLETAVEGSDFKTHWLGYLIVAVLSGCVGHYV